MKYLASILQLLLFCFYAAPIWCSTASTQDTAKVLTDFATNWSSHNSDMEVYGYVQTPIGGRPGSSSIKRPTLRELGIYNVNISNEFFSAQKQAFGIYGGYQLIGPQGKNILNKTLVSYGVTIPAGSQIASVLRFDWYNLGIFYNLHAWPKRLAILPKLELALLDFGYQFKVANQLFQRAYHHIAIRTGIAVQYQLSRNTSLSMDAMFSPVFNQLHISTFIAKFNFNLSTETCFIGAQWLRINFIDGQDMPNFLHFTTDISPVFGCTYHKN